MLCKWRGIPYPFGESCLWRPISRTQRRYARRVTHGDTFRALLLNGRKRAGLTQFELAIAVGLRQAVSVSRYEQGRGLPDPAILERLIVALALDAEEVWPLWGLAYAERTRAALDLAGD